MSRSPALQRRIYRRLERAWAAGGNLPPLAALARELAVDYKSLHRSLKALERKGLIRYLSFGRGIQPVIAPPPSKRGVPLFGEITAGTLSGAYPEPEGYLAVRNRPDCFALRVKGDSMADRIEEGDVVLLKKAPPARPGEICAVRFEESETTLKYLDWRGTNPRHFRLRPHNPAYPALDVAARDLHIDGVFDSLLRGGIVDELLIEEGGDGQAFSRS